ncbi:MULTISPECIES: hypothetical protein [Lacticaseibacillus]|uniref:Uncharacterized protein n=1 Tax=Lacticaseibacillus casei DSM 20011 = JCM 1134 = ATCC 393 TaxID=1423732 RepID=A0AAD1AMC2_LACCA|nr:hypothetical protein [Lacticaseibacillus casei]MBI6598633.1 hypothetical protein [Lacticaseibacillus casei]MBO1482305.1 hypothetical protein [Lacticaseibacillus casei]MBO2417758.1 hypothetical protein [Lacticaseibacillus casei]MCK2081945.1 hypothetical protein [Lacticaseibacillus casei]MED7631861.1 hypothetical protein [Lacticaseibacillus casei]
MAFVELENGNWINTDFIESIFKVNPSGTAWRAVLNHGEAAEITDADRIRILKAAGFVRIKKENSNAD